MPERGAPEGAGRAPCIVGVGHVALDHVFGVQALPARPVKTAAERYRCGVGCMTANALVAAARLGAAARFVGPVGDDAAAAVFAAHFAREGVAADGLRASCAAGFTQCCETESTLIGWNRDGGYAEFVAVPEPCLLPVPDDIDDDLAPLLLDTTGTAAHGLRLVQRLLPPPPRTRVLVTGAGPVGLGGLIALRDAGFDDVAVADPRPARQQLALALGARAVHPVGERSQRFDLVVECSGQHAARDQALHIVAPHGVVLWVGESDDPWLVHETRAVRRKDFFLVRSFYFPKAEHAQNIELLRRHAALYRQLIDHRCNIEELPATFARFAGGGHVKPLMMA